MPRTKKTHKGNRERTSVMLDPALAARAHDASGMSSTASVSDVIEAALIEYVRRRSIKDLAEMVRAAAREEGKTAIIKKGAS